MNFAKNLLGKYGWKEGKYIHYRIKSLADIIFVEI